jgi:hypothetical protein
MFEDEKTGNVSHTVSVHEVDPKFRNADDALLAELGYKAEFKREFSVSNVQTNLIFS